MAEQVSASVPVATLGASALTGVTYTPSETSIEARIPFVEEMPHYCFEIVNGSDVVLRRAVANNIALGNDNDEHQLITITGLMSGTTYTCRARRGDTTTYTAL